MWKPLSGYTADTLGAVVNKKNSVELYGQGAAYLADSYLNKTTGIVSFNFNMSELTNDYHNIFTFALLNEKKSFINQGTGDGFVVEFRSFDKYQRGYAVYIGTVVDGKVTNYEKMNNRIILGDLSKAKFDVKLTRNANGSWAIKIVDKTYSRTLTYNLANGKGVSSLKAGSTYVSAGNSGIDMKAVVGY